ncbi:hypothetical protein PIROE2DRAFT_61976 [Piromyces sp. E2]|nr:hypothetical protein PIROE2DRAFT_61976 [Piromyces sp. E2]|eukprot:OUM62328.1 hypothetical protein PIROE2DRAFT_61976 [Piromyces sp. E2]
MTIFQLKTSIPVTYRQALNTPDNYKWEIAITKKYKNIYENHVITIVNGHEVPDDAKILDGIYNDSKKLTAILNLYVDDILLTGNDNKIKKIANKIKLKYKISKESETRKIIGINITNKGYKINKKDYIEKITKKYLMNKTKIVYTPCREIILKQRENSKLVDVTSYKSLLGALLNIATKIPPT